MTSHPISPVYDDRSEILILGSFPSVRSRASGFYYGHPQNRFWRVLAEIYRTAVPVSNEEKRAFLLDRRIALWDVIAACEIVGSSDTQIKNPMPNDLSVILSAAPVRAVFTNGKTADRLYDRFFGKTVGLTKYCLPSTSPANAAYGMDRLTEKWKMITEQEDT